MMAVIAKNLRKAFMVTARCFSIRSSKNETVESKKILGHRSAGSKALLCPLPLMARALRSITEGDSNAAWRSGGTLHPEVFAIGARVAVARCESVGSWNLAVYGAIVSFLLFC